MKSSVPLLFFSILLFCFSPFFFSKLWAYQPLQWSPINAYILKEQSRNGPRGIKVLDPKGELIAKTLYEYNSSGRVVKEIYYNAKAQKTGYSEYRYKDGLLREERLLDLSGKVFSITRFFYDPQSKLKSLKIYGVKGKGEKKELKLEQNYYYSGKRLTGGIEIIGGKERQRNSFQIFYEGEKVKRLLFHAKGIGKILEIIYHYDKEQKLRERVRHIFLEKKVSRCIYHYDEREELKEYKYRNKGAGGKWRDERHVILLYP